jgi:molybdopterin synthase catalytic subunit
VQHLEYEAYEAYVEPIFADIAEQARSRAGDGGAWLGRIVLWHRTGPVELADSAVVVAVSAPHRPEAFAAARYCIDTVKGSAPIWKREIWSGGVDWGTCDGA